MIKIEFHCLLDKSSNEMISNPRRIFMNINVVRSIAILVATGSIFAWSGNSARAENNSEFGKMCVVQDPTDTTLNLRDKPNGKVVGRLTNGTSVSILSTVRDSKGRIWAKLSLDDSETARGYVLRKFLDCNK
jgi:Bacterial SH3 domain